MSVKGVLMQHPDSFEHVCVREKGNHLFDTTEGGGTTRDRGGGATYTECRQLTFCDVPVARSGGKRMVISGLKVASKYYRK